MNKKELEKEYKDLEERKIKLEMKELIYSNDPTIIYDEDYNEFIKEIEQFNLDSDKFTTKLKVLL